MHQHKNQHQYEPKVYIDAQWDPEEGNLGTLPIAMQVFQSCSTFMKAFDYNAGFIYDDEYWMIYLFPNHPGPTKFDSVLKI